MSTGYSSRAWACPFFKWDEKGKTHCEGGCMSMPDKKSYSDYADRYCGDIHGWKSCTFAAALLKYYDRTLTPEELEKSQ